MNRAMFEHQLEYNLINDYTEEEIDKMLIEYDIDPDEYADVLLDFQKQIMHYVKPTKNAHIKHVNKQINTYKKRNKL